MGQEDFIAFMQISVRSNQIDGELQRGATRIMMSEAKAAIAALSL